MIDRLLILLTVALVVLAVPGARADITGSTVTMTSPDGPINPITPVAIPFEFSVRKDTLSSEPIVHVWVELPVFVRHLAGTTFFEEIVPGRPDFVATWVGETIVWVEQDPIEGGILLGEETLVGFMGMFASILPDSVPLSIQWWLVGSLGNDCSGTIPFVYGTTTQKSTWGSIKALYANHSPP